MRKVDVLQFVVLTFGVSAKLKSNDAPAQLKLSQKILSNNCGCISQCMMTNYCVILQLLLPHVYSMISIKEQCPATLVSLFQGLLPSGHISVRNYSIYEAVRITPSK